MAQCAESSRASGWACGKRRLFLLGCNRDGEDDAAPAVLAVAPVGVVLVWSGERGPSWAVWKEASSRSDSGERGLWAIIGTTVVG